eukprot:287440-Rhodomonas_salina.1
MLVKAAVAMVSKIAAQLSHTPETSTSERSRMMSARARQEAFWPHSVLLAACAATSPHPQSLAPEREK